MNQTIYIKAPQCIEVDNPTVKLGDFLSVSCADPDCHNTLCNAGFYQFIPGRKQQIVVSVLKVISFIRQLYPDADIENLGEGDFILSYQPASRFESIRHKLFSFFICLTAFFGGGYAIMAYNTDVGAKELFTNLSMLYTGNAKSGVMLLAVFYSIGLTLGMLLFFNHLGNKKLSPDPTPLEVQMRLYEKDVSTTIIKDVSRRNENMDVRS